MNRIEERIREELAAHADRLPAAAGDLAAVVRRGRRRVLAGRAAMLVVAGMVAVTAAWLTRAAGDDLPIADDPPPAPTVTAPPSQTAPGMLMAGPTGIEVRPAAGAGRTLVSDRFYEEIRRVVSDRAGGIVFQHAITPLPWVQGSILWLPAGADRPQVLVAPAEQFELLEPLGVYRDDAGRTRLLYRSDAGAGTELRDIALATGEQRTRGDSVDRLVTASMADSGRLVMVVGDADCSRVLATPAGADDGLEAAAGPVLTDRSCDAQIEALAATEDGRRVFTLEASPAGRWLVGYDLDSGAELIRLDPGDAWALSAEGSTMLVAGTTARLFSLSELDWTDDLGPAGGAATLYGGELAVAAGAILGPGTGELPCSPTPLAPGGSGPVPAPVEAAWTRLRSLAAGCDYDGLAELVAESGAPYAFGEAGDPARTWIVQARIGGREPLSTLAAVLATAPASLGPGDADGYVWPAVFATDADLDWEKIESIYSTTELQAMREFGGYTGLRVGLDSEGRLLFLITGGD